MTSSDIVRAIVEVLGTVQVNSGRSQSIIDGNTCPIGDLDGFDSLNAVEATVELGDRLGLDIPCTNAFINEKGTEARKVGEVADYICDLASKGGR